MFSEIIFQKLRIFKINMNEKQKILHSLSISLYLMACSYSLLVNVIELLLWMTHNSIYRPFVIGLLWINLLILIGLAEWMMRQALEGNNNAKFFFFCSVYSVMDFVTGAHLELALLIDSDWRINVCSELNLAFSVWPYGHLDELNKNAKNHQFAIANTKDFVFFTVEIIFVIRFLPPSPPTMQLFSTHSYPYFSFTRYSCVRLAQSAARHTANPSSVVL